MLKEICSMDMRNSRNINVKDYTNSILNGNDYSLLLYHAKPFRKCSREIEHYVLIFDRHEYNLIALRSYNTVCCVVIEDCTTFTKWVVVSGNYSQTTTQHLHKFFKEYNIPINSLLDIEYCTLYEII